MSSETLSETTGPVEYLPPVKRGRGRPKKTDIDRYRKRPVGRPPGDKYRMEELKTRLLATSGEGIIDKVISIARNDEHPGQMAALKMCIDRMLPMSLFEKDVKGGRSAVTINIVGVEGNISVDGKEDNVIDMEEVDG